MHHGQLIMAALTLYTHTSHAYHRLSSSFPAMSLLQFCPLFVLVSFLSLRTTQARPYAQEQKLSPLNTVLINDTPTGISKVELKIGRSLRVNRYENLMLPGGSFKPGSKLQINSGFGFKLYFGDGITTCFWRKKEVGLNTHQFTSVAEMCKGNVRCVCLQCVCGVAHCRV